MEEDRMLSDEVLLALIKKNSGGGGGTTNYNLLENKPQIAGTTLQGNKSLSDLGIASETALGNVSNAVTAITDGQTINSFSDVEAALSGKQDALTFDNVPTENSNNPVKSGGVYSALADKQDALTAGQYIDITNDEISVNRELIPQIIRYHLDFATSYKCVVTKFEGETQKSQTTYDFNVPNVFTIDDAFTLACPDWNTGWVMTLLKDSTEHSTGYTKTIDPFYYHGTYDESFPSEDLSGYKLVIKSEMDTALADKQDKTDNNLQTTNKTVVGAVNELKSGLTDVNNVIDGVASSPLLFGVYPNGNSYGNATITLPCWSKSAITTGYVKVIDSNGTNVDITNDASVVRISPCAVQVSMAFNASHVGKQVLVSVSAT